MWRCDRDLTTGNCSGTEGLSTGGCGCSLQTCQSRENFCLAPPISIIPPQRLTCISLFIKVTEKRDHPQAQHMQDGSSGQAPCCMTYLQHIFPSFVDEFHIHCVQQSMSRQDLTPGRWEHARLIFQNLWMATRGPGSCTQAFGDSTGNTLISLLLKRHPSFKETQNSHLHSMQTYYPHPSTHLLSSWW